MNEQELIQSLIDGLKSNVIDIHTVTGEVEKPDNFLALGIFEDQREMAHTFLIRHALEEQGENIIALEFFEVAWIHDQWVRSTPLKREDRLLAIVQTDAKIQELGAVELTNFLAQVLASIEKANGLSPLFIINYKDVLGVDLRETADDQCTSRPALH